MSKKRYTQMVSLLLAALLLLPVLPLFRPEAAALTKGDVSGDGKVTSADARLCLRRAVGLETYAKGSAKYNACDYNGDGSVTAADARLILRAAVGLRDDTPAQQKFSVPATVYNDAKLTVTLTDYRTKYSSEWGQMVLICIFNMKNKSSVPYDPHVDGVTVNGLQILEPDFYAKQIHPASAVDLIVVIPGSYFDINQAGNAAVDELLVHFSFFDVSRQEWTISASAALYPTNKKPGAAVRYAADSVKYSNSYDHGDFLFAFQDAARGFRQDGKLDYVDALFYFKNKSGRDYKVDLTEITLNGNVRFSRDVNLFVFAGTAAEPEIYMDPNFFAWTSVSKLSTLSFRLTVSDAGTGQKLYSAVYTLNW